MTSPTFGYNTKLMFAAPMPLNTSYWTVVGTHWLQLVA